MLRTERLRLRAQRRDLEILAALAIVGVVVIQADHTVPSPPSHRPVSTDRLPTRLRGSSAREGMDARVVGTLVRLRMVQEAHRGDNDAYDRLPTNCDRGRAHEGKPRPPRHLGEH